MAHCEEGLFSDVDFVNACEELDTPDLEGWEFFTESQDITIYRLQDKTSGLFQYKIYGELDDVTPDICTQVYMDLEYRKEWDSYVKELSPKEFDGKTLIYWNVNYPFPLWNRDYVYGREYREIDGLNGITYICLAKPFTTPSLPEKSGVVRVRDFLQSCAMCSNGKFGSKACMKYFDNPGGNIPTWVINWAAKTGVPQFLKSMHKACRNYPEYLKKKENLETKMSG